MNMFFIIDYAQMYVDESCTLAFCNTQLAVVMNGYMDGINGDFRDEWYTCSKWYIRILL